MWLMKRWAVTNYVLAPLCRILTFSNYVQSSGYHNCQRPRTLSKDSVLSPQIRTGLTLSLHLQGLESGCI